jgi:hypothetical protein
LATTAVCLLAGASPFLALQGVFNHGVTGHWLKTPHQMYTELYHPAATFGSKGAAGGARPASDLPQKQAYYDEFVLPEAADFARQGLIGQWFGGGRLWRLWGVATRCNLLVLLVPVGLLALGRRRWVFWGMLPLFVLLYSFSVFMTVQYDAVAAPAVLFTALLGVRAVGEAWPRARHVAAAALTLGVAAAGVAFLPQFLRPGVRDEPFEAPELVALDEALAQLPGRSLVLFRWAPGLVTHIEPVYNTDVAWPDDARVVRAHDRGPQRNLELFRYYARRQPDRMVYLMDRRTFYRTGDVRAALTPLGRVDELAKRADATTGPTTGPASGPASGPSSGPATGPAAGRDEAPHAAGPGL